MGKRQKRQEYCRVLFYFIFILGCVTGAKAQIITTFAGNGTAGYGGDGRPAISCELNYPSAVATDLSGNIYIADNANNCIRKINMAAGGIITTIAGNDTPGFSGDGGAATLASLNDPIDVVEDNAGNIYIADVLNNCIRKVDTAGIITTIAGNESLGSGYTGDGGPATMATMFSPTGVAVDGAGNVYIADQNNACIRKVSATGIITTIAGTGMAGSSGDSVAATVAMLSHPWGVTVDGAGNIYISDGDNCEIRKVNAAGIITTIAGVMGPGYSGDGFPATAAKLAYPKYMTLDSIGNIYFGDFGNHRIRKINTSGIITTIAGNGTPGYDGDGCAATAAELNHPYGVALNGSGNIYIADAGNNRIRLLGPDHPPAFTNGRSQSLIACENSITSIDSALEIIDSDAGQPEIWSLLSSPAHGTARVTDTATSTGGITIPAGLSYQPATGYTGNDTFMAIVTDCNNATDTTAIYVTVVYCRLGVATSAAHAQLQMEVSPNPGNGILTVTLSSAGNEDAQLIITNMVGEKVKEFIIPVNKETQIRLDAPPGMYFLSAITDQGRQTAKVVVR